MSAPRRLRLIVWKWVAPLVGVTALGLAVFLYFHTPRERAFRLIVTAGDPLDTRHELAEVLRDEVRARGLTLELRGTVGSEQALDQVEARAVDLALVQGGLAVDGRPNVRQVAALQVEPLHLLVKKELSGEASSHLTALEGKTVNPGEVGSGTHTLSVEVLGFAGLQPRAGGPGRGYVPVPMSRQQMLGQQDTARLPDAVFIVSSLPSRTAKVLVTRHGYRLVPLRFGEAFALEALSNEERRGRSQRHRIDKGRTFAATVPAFTYSVEPPVPAAPLPSLGNRLLLVAHKDVAPQAVLQLVEAVYATEFARIIRPALDPKLMEAPPEFPWHAGARLYQERNQPLVSGELVEYAHKALAIAGAAASGLVVLWQWVKLRNQSLRGEEFKRYINRVTRVEEQAMQIERGHEMDLRALLALQDQLGRLKTEALDRFTEGELEGKELMAAYLAQVNDARAYLTRLISQRRETLEGRARSEGRPLSSLWEEAAGPGGARPPTPSPWGPEPQAG
jgi:TRAP-type uncharacterized transport system substrate-binding protein